MDNDFETDGSDEDIAMTDAMIKNHPKPLVNEDENMVNDDIEDIDSEEEPDMVYQQPVQPKPPAKVPGLALGGLGSGAPSKPAGLGLNLGAIKPNPTAEPEKKVPTGFNLKMPVPSLNIGQATAEGNENE